MTQYSKKFKRRDFIIIPNYMNSFKYAVSLDVGASTMTHFHRIIESAVDVKGRKGTASNKDTKWLQRGRSLYRHQLRFEVVLVRTSPIPPVLVVA